MNKIQKLLMLIISIIIVILLLILKLNKNIQDNNSIIQNEIEGEITEKVFDKNNNGFEKVDDANMFFTVLNCLNNYISVLKYEINENDTLDENPYLIKNEEDRKKILFSMLDVDYKGKNNIQIEEDIMIGEKLDSVCTVIPIEMKVKYSDDVQIYALNVYIENYKLKELEEKFYIIKINNKNSTFSIKPIDNCESIDDIYEEELVSYIQLNDYNKYYLETINNEALAKIYIQRYKYMIINYPQIFYDEYMEDEYKNKRFGSYQNFKKFIDNNFNEILTLKAMKYTKQYENDCTNFVIIDQYDNMYIFIEKSIMNYTLKLDTYTIDEQVFIKEYQNATNEKKVQMNVDKFIQMINRHDYRTSYNCISEGFKNNYFATEEQFESYIKNTFFTYNNLEFKNIEKKGSNLYVCTIQLTDLTKQSTETKEVTIIMQLNDNLDFEMSFSV